MKKYISLLLIVILMMASIYTPILADETQQIESNETTNNIYNLEGCFGSISIDTDTNKVYVDGISSSLSNALDISEKKSEKLINSQEKLVNYCNDNGYTIEEKNGDLVISNPYQTKRIIVYTNKLTETYDAVSSSFLYNAYTLEYATEEATAIAYEKLVSEFGTDKVILDEIINVYSSWQDNYTEKNFYQYLPNIRSNMYPLIEDINAYAGEKNEVVVAVIDSGYDTDTEFYADRYLSDLSTSFIAEDGAEDGVPEDIQGHGTAVCFSLANCTPDNVKIVVYKIFDASGNTSISIARQALLQAYRDGADIVNMSFGGDVFGLGFDIELRTLYNSGIDLIAAAGNEGTETVDEIYPANSKYTIAVSSISNDKTDEKYALSGFSTYGSSIMFSSPGEHLALISNDGKMYYCSGTSYAAPILTGQLATLKTFADTSSVTEDINLLKMFISSDFDSDYENDSNYRSYEYGYGYLDFGNVAVCDCGESNCHVLYHSPLDAVTEATTTETITTIETTTTETSSEDTDSSAGETTYVNTETTEETTVEESITIPNKVAVETTTHLESESSTTDSTTTLFVEESTSSKSIGSVKVKLPKRIKIKVKKKSVTIKYRKRNKEDYVTIYYSKTKKFKKFKELTTKRKRTKLKFKKKGVYYIRIKAFRIVNGKKYFSKLSKKRRFKIK